MRLDELDWSNDSLMYPKHIFTAIIPGCKNLYWIRRDARRNTYTVREATHPVCLESGTLRWVDGRIGTARDMYSDLDAVTAQCIVYDLIQKHKGAD